MNSTDSIFTVNTPDGSSRLKRNCLIIRKRLSRRQLEERKNAERSRKRSVILAIRKKKPADNQSPDADENQENDFSEDEMFDTVYKMMQDSERELNSKQILQILSSSGIVLNTFFHEFNAINTQFHVRASQIRSRVRHILKGQEYTGIAAYNPYPWIDALEKTDRVTAAFLDVVMEGLKKESLKRQEISMQKVIRDILEKWSLLLEEKHIVIRPDIFAEKELDDRIQMAVVDMYIILNNFLLNAAWFLEREHNPKREIAFTLEESADMLYLYMETMALVWMKSLRTIRIRSLRWEKLLRKMLRHRQLGQGWGYGW